MDVKRENLDWKISGELERFNSFIIQMTELCKLCHCCIWLCQVLLVGGKADRAGLVIGT